MNEDIVVPALFFLTVMVLAMGIPLVRAYVRRQEAQPPGSSLSPELAMRLDRIESMVETISVEVERLSEGQRFTTRLLSEGAVQTVAPASRAAVHEQQARSEVTHA
jgi:hypothetical protein